MGNIAAAASASCADSKVRAESSPWPTILLDISISSWVSGLSRRKIGHAHESSAHLKKCRCT